MDEILEPLEKDVSVYFNKYEELNLGFWKWRLPHKNLIEITINVKNLNYLVVEDTRIIKSNIY